MKTKRNLLQICLLAAILLALPAAVQAQFTYTTNNGTITITGYTGSGSVVTIPSTINGYPVTSIGEGAFAAQTSLTNVTIPRSVTSIGEVAFEDCTSLINVSIPNSVTSIADGAFAYCYSLAGVYFQGNAPYDGGYIFYYDQYAVGYYLPWTTGWGSTFSGLQMIQSFEGQDGVQYSANPTNGLEPLIVQFTTPSIDSSNNTIVKWNWNFGDGTTSTVQNPSHTYLTNGVYYPNLTATNSGGGTVFGYGPFITVTATPPVAVFSPLTNGQVVANLAGIGGYVSYNFDLGSVVNFSIHELDINGGLGRWWNGTNFQSISNAFPASLSGTNWLPAAGVAFPQLNSGQSYQLTVTATNSTSQASTTITVQAPITVLNWDPGQTALGTMVLQNPNTNGGNYWFQISPQSPAVGVWRTALNVLAGQAGVYMSQGSPPTTNSYSFASARLGSNGFVLDSSQFSAGQTWYILVNASTNAQWNLVTGDVFVYNLGSLAADNSSSTNAPIGAEGMIFFNTTIPTNTLAWQLWLNGSNNTVYVKKSSAPDPQSYDLAQAGQMLVVPPYLSGGTFNGFYFISVPGNPGTPINLDSRQQPITPLPFGGYTNVTVGTTNFPYVTYQVQVPVQQIAWQLNLTPSNGVPDIAARLAAVPNEFNNDAYSDVGGSVGNSISLVPPPASYGSGSPGLSAGTYYVTVYGSGTFSCGFTNGSPVITPVSYVFSITNDAPNRVGWRYYSVSDINSQLGSLGWLLLLSNAPAGSEIAIRRNAVPGQWNYRNYANDDSYDFTSAGYVDLSSYINVLQQPGHQADIWYIGVYSPSQPLTNFVLRGQLLVPQPMSFDSTGNNATVTSQVPGVWQYYSVVVPSDTNLLGWDVRLTNVTAGSPQMVVSRDTLPTGIYGSTFPGGPPPNDFSYWPSGDQWLGGQDWTGDSLNSTGGTANVSMLAMGMGNPLQPGTYYIGVYDPTYTNSYTLVSRGIGITNYSIPVYPLGFVGSASTNLVPREAAYYSVVIPTNTPSWRVRLAPTVGDALLLVQQNNLPCSQSGGSAVYGVPDGGIKVAYAGNEHYTLLPQGGQTNIPAGTYYLAVASEGVNSGGNQIGSNTTSYAVQSLGTLSVSNLGAVGAIDLLATNALLEGGDDAAYQFTVPSNTLSMTLQLTFPTNCNPQLTLLPGSQLPSADYVNGNDRTSEGGQSWNWTSDSGNLITIPNPVPGTYSLLVHASAVISGQVPDAAYGVVIHALIPTPVNFDGAGNNVSVTNQLPANWQYFQVNVPSDTNLLGWDVRLTNVTAGSPQMVVSRDTLPTGIYGSTFPGGPPPNDFSYWPSGDQWLGGQDWTGDSLNSTGGTANVSMLAMGMGNPLQPGTYYIGVYDPTYTNSYTLVSRGIGITNYSIPVYPLGFVGSASTNLVPREAAYYSVVIPTNTPSWRVRLAPTVGDALLLVQQNNLPCSQSGGSAVYGVPDGGIKVAYAGNEHYTLLPQGGQTNIPAGTYYLAVASEGVNSGGNQIGSNTTSYAVQSLGTLSVSNLGAVGAIDLLATNALLEGGDDAAYQFTVPSNTLSMTLQLTFPTNCNPQLTLLPGSQLPSADYVNGNDRTSEGGQSWNWTSDSGNLITIPNPVPGTYSLLVHAGAVISGQVPDAAYGVVIHALIPTPVNFDGAGNNVSVTNQLPANWQYFQVNVPSDTNLLGWDVRLTNVTAGSPQMVVSRDTLPTGIYGSTFPGGPPPNDFSYWPSGDQWLGGQDWTGDSLNSTGGTANVSMLAMGMGNPLQPGTYYIGVYDPTYTNSYTLVSRGIGITNYSIPVYPLGFVGSASTNLVPREAAYYSVVIPTNTPSWRVRLAPTVGDALLLVQQNNLPCSQSGGSAVYGVPDGGIKVAYAGNEHYTLLPQGGQTNIPAGTYYLAVASEGVNSGGNQIGSNTTSYAVQSLGTLSVSNLGAVGAIDLLATNALLEGGDDAAYQFTVPSNTNTLGIELRFEGVVGNPLMTLLVGSQLPSADYVNGYDRTTEGGQSWSWASGSLITVPNPVPVTYSLLVHASAVNSQVPNAAYTVRVRQLLPPNLNISSLLNTNGGTNVVSGTLADTESAFFQVNVPTNVNGAPVLGWNLGLSESSGSPTVRVRQNYLPDNTCDTTTFASGSIVIAPPYLTPGIWYVEVKASGNTTFTLTSSVITTNTTTRNPWVMPAIGQTNTTPGLTMPEFGDTGVDTNGVPLPGDQGVDLAQGQYDFYAIVVPTNNAGLLRTELQAISGNPNLYIRAGAAPTFNHHASGSCDNTVLIDRQLTGSTTEYGNWVPLNGQTATNLTPGVWVLSVFASGNANARFRLQLSCGNSATNGLVQDLPLDGSVTYNNQQLAGGDWRYYRVQIPTNAPNNWVINWTRSQGSAHLFVRDTVPPGDGAQSSYNYNSYPSQAITWFTDNKNQGPYLDFASPGGDTLTTPPLRPGDVYYLGFWSPDDATFSITCTTNGGLINITNIVSLYGGLIGGTVPPFGSVQYLINVPTNAAGIVFNASNSANLVLSLEQGTVALTGGPAHWVSSGANSSLNQPFTDTWPWLPGYLYYLTVTNNSGMPGTFNLTAADLMPTSLASDPTAVSANPMKVWFTVTNAGNGTAASPYYGYWYDQVTLSTNGTLAGAVTSWSWYYYGTLAAGASYTLTNSITLPSLSAGTYYLILTTDAGNYVPEGNKANNTSAPVSFTVGVVSTQPSILGISLSGTNLVINGSNGMSATTYYVLMSTNLAQPISQWTRIATNILNASGNFTITATNAVNPKSPQRFYILQSQ